MDVRGMRTRPRDVLLHRANAVGHRGAGRQREARARDDLDRDEIGERIVGKLLEAVRIDGHQKVRREEQRRAVRIRVLHRIDAGAP